VVILLGVSGAWQTAKPSVAGVWHITKPSILGLGALPSSIVSEAC